MRTLSLPTLLSAMLLAGCGYSPLYAPQAGAAQAASRVSVGTVQMVNPEKNVGQRRVAQVVSQRLQLQFPGQPGNADVLEMNIRESATTLSIETTAAIKRAQITLEGNVVIMAADGTQRLNTSVSANAAYNVENTPYSTESGKTYARLTAARNLADEAARRVYLFYRTQPSK